jgi:AraC family transcriptional regulator
MNVEIKELAPLRTVAVRHVGPYHRISEAFSRLGQVAAQANLFRERPMMLAIYHDDPETTPEQELRSDAALVVGEDVAVPPGLTEQRIPGGRYACATFIGPYEHLGDAWARFMGQWLPQSGERLGSGTSFEVYVNTPVDVPKEQLKTELYLSLA